MCLIAHHAAKRRVALTEARRVWSLLIWPVKNSRTRCAAFGVGVNSGAGCRSGEGAMMISVFMGRLIGSPDAGGDGLGQAEKVLRVPGIEGFSLGFERAMTEKGVVDGAAGESRRGGLLDRLEVVALVQ